MKRALIVKLGAIGDVIMAVPAVFALHQQGYSIDWIAGPAVAPLLRCYSWIRVIQADDKAVLGGSPAARIKAVMDVWRAVGLGRYDLLATLYYDLRWRVFTLPVRAARRLTLSSTDRDRRILPTRSHADEFARILLNLKDTCRENSLRPLRPDRLPPSPVADPKARRVAMVPAGASNMVRQQTLRRWPADRYVSLAAALLARGDEVVLLGGPDDVWIRTHFEVLPSHPRLIDCIGATSLPEFISLADSCSLVLSHDTGPLHLAGLSLAPVLALFGPTDPGSFLPRRAGVRVLWGGEGLACRPCYDGRDFAPCDSNGCMRDITVEAVLNTIDEMLASSMSTTPFPIFQEYA
jgi:heptosyltransferase-2